MVIAIVQLNYHIGNFEENTKKILDNLKEAKNKKILNIQKKF